MSLSKCLKRNRTATSFKSGWLDDVVETQSTQLQCKVGLKIRKIFSYNDDSSVICLVCREAKITGLVRNQRRKSVYNFGGCRNRENLGKCKRRRREAAIAEGKKPLTIRRSGERRKLHQRGLGRSPRSRRNF